MFKRILRWFAKDRMVVKPSHPGNSTTKEKGRRRASASQLESMPNHSRRSEETVVPHSNAVIGANPPWEKGIVSALRDLQWLARIKTNSVPGGFASFDWTAEQLGDAALDINDRFYLVELKSSRNARYREKTKLDGAYKALKRQIEAFGTMDDEVRGKMFVLSMRCHQLAYWMDADPFDRAARRVGLLAFNPYLTDILSDVAEAGNRSRAVAETMLMRMALGTDRCEPMQRYEYLNVVRLFDGSARILVRGEERNGQPSCEKQRLGLKGELFQIYINWLVEAIGGTDRPLRMVLMSASGRLMRFISNTSELVAILAELKLKPAPVSDMQTHREQAKEWPWMPGEPETNEGGKPHPSTPTGRKPGVRNRPGS